MCADILTQREVDALLASVEGGQLPLPGGRGPRRSGLPYFDFKRPERISNDQIRAIEAIHESMARNLGASLSAFLRTIVDCKLATVDQITYSEFVMQLPNPTCFSVLSVAPLEGKLVLEVNPSIAFPIIDKLLGGQVTSLDVPNRPLTSIELALIGRIIDLALSHLREVWRPVRELNFRVVDTESNPQLLPIAPPNDGVVLVVFEIRMGPAAGQINVCLPYATLEPVLVPLSQLQSWFRADRQHSSTAASRAALSRRLRGAPLELVAELARTRLTVAQFLDLATGDILRTDQRQTAPVVVRVGTRQKFTAQAGTRAGKKAVRILRASS